MPQKHSSSRQPLWEKEEALILAEGCLLHKNGIPRRDIVSAVSAVLRQRARDKGMTISDKFRNENGINMQMTSLQRELNDTARDTWHSSKLFRDLGTLYREDHAQFDLLLNRDINACYRLEKFLRHS